MKEFEIQGPFHCVIWKVYVETSEKQWNCSLNDWLRELVQALLNVNLIHYCKANLPGQKLWPFKTRNCQVREQYAFYLLYNNRNCIFKWIRQSWTYPSLTYQWAVYGIYGCGAGIECGSHQTVIEVPHWGIKSCVGRVLWSCHSVCDYRLLAQHFAFCK